MSKLYNTKYFHRDLSWLRFNHRVLQEAADARNPLYERIKFLAIFSSNLDEFFKVRVSDIRQVKNIDKSLRKKLITKPNQVLKEIKKQVDLQQEAFGEIFSSEIVPALEKEQILLLNHTQFSATQKLVAQNYFNEELKQNVTLQTFNKGTKDALFVENEALYLTSFNDDELTVVEIPQEVPRFFVFPKQNGKHFITFVDDILKHCLRQSPKQEKDVAFYAIKVSKDAELYIDDEFSGNLKEKIKASLSKRETGQATRVLIDAEMPKNLRTCLHDVLDVNNTDIIEGGRYHNFKDFFAFPNPTEKNLSNEKLEPIPHPMLAEKRSIFDIIDEKDQLIHYPYQSFEPIIRLVEEAAVDPNVTKIKITIYRAAKESRLNDAIVLAAKNGKDVTVFIEVKARFDEQNNLKWGAIFEQHGATVIYSYPDIKVHSKILLIERTKEDNTQRYAYIATGNFNEKTATLYTDFGLMTAHKKLTKELDKVFMVLNRKLIVPKTKRLLVSPFSTRIQFIEKINTEITLANAGREAYIILKMNSLQDKQMIKLLYNASNAGVKIQLLIRGMCSLVPGIKNQSSNITVTSIVDRFLEHGRVYIFGNDGKEELYIGSADWMTRNLTHRIEVVTPIYDKDHHNTIKELIQLQIDDNVKSRIIDIDQNNNYVVNKKNKLQAQLATYEYFKATK